MALASPIPSPSLLAKNADLRRGPDSVAHAGRQASRGSGRRACPHAGPHRRPPQGGLARHVATGRVDLRPTPAQLRHLLRETHQRLSLPLAGGRLTHGNGALRVPRRLTRFRCSVRCFSPSTRRPAAPATHGHHLAARPVGTACRRNRRPCPAAARPLDTGRHAQPRLQQPGPFDLLQEGPGRRRARPLQGCRHEAAAPRLLPEAALPANGGRREGLWFGCARDGRMRAACHGTAPLLTSAALLVWLRRRRSS